MPNPPNINLGQISQPQGELTPEFSWITGDTINLILAGYFYYHTLEHVNLLAARLDKNLLLTGNTPFRVDSEPKIADDIPIDVSETEEISDEEFQTRLNAFTAPSSPASPLPPTPGTVPDPGLPEERSSQQDNYIFMID